MENLSRAVVKRSEWGRGNPLRSFLYDPQSHKRCCLGFAGNAVGISDSNMNLVDTPGRAGQAFLEAGLGSLLKWPWDGTFGNSDICRDLMKINDDNKVSDSEREIDLKLRGIEAGIDFHFED